MMDKRVLAGRYGGQGSRTILDSGGRPSAHIALLSLSANIHWQHLQMRCSVCATRRQLEEDNCYLRPATMHAATAILHSLC
ncbi:hypothetical protein NPIL_309601 [Nephila pilipes]|uniref:Uncharacterized protein n=1 Tax=Nephila pilipes TaxID=299642 RepID=A0A8X6T762_NEPPI|nr:hypothetical protein NPIL_309601 [Nephila pilipes]